MFATSKRQIKKHAAGSLKEIRHGLRDIQPPGSPQRCGLDRKDRATPKKNIHRSISLFPIPLDTIKSHEIPKYTAIFIHFPYSEIPQKMWESRPRLEMSSNSTHWAVAMHCAWCNRRQQGLISPISFIYIHLTPPNPL